MAILDNATSFIKEALSDDSTNQVLVHCEFGVSRSSSCVIAYIMETDQVPYDKAYEQVLAIRKWTAPNSGFRD